MKGICKDCGEFIELENHSELGGHKPPYVKLCEECHNIRHEVKRIRFKETQRGNLKNAKGTSKRKNK